MNDANLEFRTLLEQKDNKYPENVAMACFKITDDFDIDDDTGGGEAYYEGYTNQDEIFEIVEDDPHFIITSGEYEEFSKWGWHWPCQVLKNEGDGKYTVRILAHPSPKEEQEGWVRRNQARILTNYSGTLIKFIHKSYMSDQYLPGAFRHSIEIQDSMFPSQWKDLVVDGEIAE